MSTLEGVEEIVGDRYRIAGELGRGGMGVVYRARDVRRDMDVAIKLCWRKHADALLWLKREFRAVSSLRHDNLVELFELVANDRGCYFTMEYLLGEDPRAWVGSLRPRRVDEDESTLAPLRAADGEGAILPPAIDWKRFHEVLAQLAEALAFLHGRGVIHRDIKPSNVLVASGTVKLLDFGIALDRRRADQAVVRERRVIGTSSYLAPEYLSQRLISTAMDMYAFGVLAFELATGLSPSGERGRDGQIYALPLASRINPEVPKQVDDLIDRLLSSNPLRRPTAAAVASELDTSKRPRRTRHAKCFVGRDAEAAKLGEVLASRAPRARVVVVAGPSGIGKSALVDDAITRARAAGTLPAHVWRGRCHDRELLPFRAFDFVVDDLASHLAIEDEADVGKFADVRRHASALARVFPAVGAKLGVPPDDESRTAEGTAIDPRAVRERALLAMTRLLDGVIADQAGLITIDDLQWADPDSLELLALIAARATRPLAIVATWTRDDVAELLATVGNVEVIELASLAADRIDELIATLAPAITAEQRRAANALAAGNPYVAEQLARELADTGALAPEQAEQRLLDRLEPVARGVADFAALATGAITFEQLCAVSVDVPAQLWRAVRTLEDARVLRSAPSQQGEPVYLFYHQRLRDAADAAIDDDRRQLIHRRFAEVGERDGRPSEELAHHYERAGERSYAAHWATRAAETARDQLAWRVAADWYSRAIALGAQVQEQLADCLFLGGRLADAARIFEQLADTARDRDHADRWRVRAAESYIKLGELSRGIAMIDDVLGRRGQPRAQSRIGGAARTLAVAARWFAPRPDRAVTDPVLAAAYRVIASFLSTSYPIEAFEYVLRGIVAAEVRGDHDAHALGMAVLATYVAVGSLGRFGDRAIARAQRLSEQSGTPYAKMVAAGSAGILALLRGDWTGMRAAHAEGRAVCERLGLERSWEASFLGGYHAIGEHYAGEPARALAILDAVTDASDDLISRAVLGHCRGRALLLAGDVAGARACLREHAGAPGVGYGMVAVYRAVLEGELALEGGDYARARTIGEALARLCRAQWLTVIPAISAMIDTLIATADLGAPGRAGAARTRARTLYRRARGSFYEVTALRLMGQAEMRLGDRAAPHTLARAAEIAAIRGGQLDRLAIDRLRGNRVDPGPLGDALTWSTARMV